MKREQRCRAEDSCLAEPCRRAISTEVGASILYGAIHLSWARYDGDLAQIIIRP